MSRPISNVYVNRIDFEPLNSIKRTVTVAEAVHKTVPDGVFIVVDATTVSSEHGNPTIVVNDTAGHVKTTKVLKQNLVTVSLVYFKNSVMVVEVRLFLFIHGMVEIRVAVHTGTVLI